MHGRGRSSSTVRRAHNVAMTRRSLSKLVLAALLVASCSAAGGNRSGPNAAVRSVTFAGAFLPQEVVATTGLVWLVGRMGPTAERCGIERVDPNSLRTSSFGLAACGAYVAANDGHIYLAATRYVPASNEAELRIEDFDIATGKSAVMAPVVATPVGSELGHMALAYGAGALWVVGWANQLLKVSPSTGFVLDRINVPTSGGGHPSIAVNQAGVWIADGPGGGPDIRRISPGSPTTSVIYSAPSSGAILWLSGAQGRIWANVATYLNGGRSVQTRLVAFDASGHKLAETRTEALGTSLAAGTAERMWSVGANQTCTGPQILWKLDGSSGISAEFTTLTTPSTNPCLTQSDTQLAVTGGFVFVLEATGSADPAGVLYRITE